MGDDAKKERGARGGRGGTEEKLRINRKVWINGGVRPYSKTGYSLTNGGSRAPQLVGSQMDGFGGGTDKGEGAGWN